MQRYSGIRSSRDPLGIPGPGQQALDLVGPGPSGDHALEQTGEPHQGLDPVELGGRHQASHDRPVARPTVQALGVAQTDVWEFDSCHDAPIPGPPQRSVSGLHGGAQPAVPLISMLSHPQ